LRWIRQLRKAGQFLTIEGSEVVVWALGNQRFASSRPTRTGWRRFDEQARALAHELAGVRP
jgi:hypothetical protein